MIDINWEYQHGLEAASQYGLEEEYKREIANGNTPKGACLEWDCLPNDWLNEYIESMVE